VYLHRILFEICILTFTEYLKTHSLSRYLLSIRTLYRTKKFSTRIVMNRPVYRLYLIGRPSFLLLSHSLYLYSLHWPQTDKWSAVFHPEEETRGRCTWDRELITATQYLSQNMRMRTINMRGSLTLLHIP